MAASRLAPIGAAATDARPARIFVGLKIADEIARELAQIAQELDRADVRAVAAEDIHLTLVPPWDEVRTSDAVEKLCPVAARFAAFALIIQHVGYGPDLRRPRLLWADCAAMDELAALRAALLEAYNQTDERPFRPHVTLARIRENGRAIAQKHPIDRPLSLTQRVESVELFRSPAPGERGYRILASVRLADASHSRPDS